MKTDPAPGTRVRFGTFEADFCSGELRRKGLKVKIQELPFQVLVLLLERPGEVVSREDLRRRLWPADTFVDFDQGLNKAINKLREALGDDANNPRFVETLPRRGYRFIGLVETAVGLQVDRRKSVRTFLFSAAMVVAVLGALLALNVAGLRYRVIRAVRPVHELPHQIHSIAVLPFDNLSGDPEQEYFADGMTDEMITRLSKISGLTVINRASAMRYKGTREPLPEIAQELKVDALIEGSVLRSGGHVRINVQLVDPQTEHNLWAQPYDRDLGDVLALYSDVARGVAERIRVTITPEEQRRLASTGPVNPRAYEAYLRGLYFWNKRTGEDMRKGLHYFEQAVEIDPKYAPAYAGITVSYVQLASYGPVPSAMAYARAKAAALKAVALDDSLAEAHNALSQVYFNYDWEWSAAERESRRAIELNPGYAEAHHGYGHLLLCMGRHDEALAEMKKARNLDPLSTPINDSVAIALFFRGDYDLAIKQWQSTLDSNPGFWVARRYLGRGYLAKGLPEEALREFKSAVDASKGNPLTIAWLGYGYAVSGKTVKAREILAALQQKAKKGYVSPYQFAVVHAGLGDKDQAIEYLEKAFQERYIRLVRLNQPQDFPSLRSDPRFQTMLSRMNFPQ